MYKNQHEGMRQEKKIVIFGELLKCWHLAGEVKEMFILYPLVHLSTLAVLAMAGREREREGGRTSDSSLFLAVQNQDGRLGGSEPT